MSAGKEAIRAALDTCRQRLVAHGVGRERIVMLGVALRRFLESGLTKRDFLARLARDPHTTRELAQLADAAIDYHRVFVLGRRDLDDCSDLHPAPRPAGGDTIPLPPPELIEFVMGNRELGAFAETGLDSAADVLSTLERHDLTPDGFGRILDFGCGVGRVLRILTGVFPEVEWHGSDLNPRLIEYCTAAFARAPTRVPPRFVVNEPDKPLGFVDYTFDFIYALSVFSHLDEKLARFWSNELGRILRPRGYLLITTMGSAFFDRMTTSERGEFLERGAVIRNRDIVGHNACAAFLAESFVRDALAINCEVVDFIPGGAYGNGHQDVYLLRRRE